MVLNLDILTFVSLPEAFLNLIIILLLAGLKDSLSLIKLNVLRFIFSLVFMLVATSLIRPIAPNVAVSFIAHSFVYSIIITVVYRIDIRKAFYSVTLLSFFFATFENIFYPYIVAYCFGGIENYQSSNINIIVCAIPTRLFQIGVISFLWRFVDELLVTKLNKKFYNIFVANFFVLTLVQYFFSYFFTVYFNRMSVTLQVFFSAALFLIMVVFNVIIYCFIYFMVRGIITQGYRRYQILENSTTDSFSKAYQLLENNDIKGAMSLIEGYANVKAKREEG